MALDITYEGKSYVLDLEDMDTAEARAMERFGVKSLKDLETGISAGEVDALTVTYWLMLKQNGEPGVRLDRVEFKPIKFVKALIRATDAEAKRQAEERAEEDAPGKTEGA